MKLSNSFYPSIISSLKKYNLQSFYSDIISGIIVGIIALPLAIAFGIASGASPQQGIITAIIAGFIISVFGGSTVQIGGPTGAFIVIVYGIIEKYGFDGLVISTVMAGIILIIIGLFKFGSLIKYIPSSVVTGFTSGIAVVIFSSQMPSFFGMNIENIPANFIAKWNLYLHSFSGISITATLISIITVALIMFCTKFYPKIPSAFLALVLSIAVSKIFSLPVETISSKFGTISFALPSPRLPNFTFELICSLIVPAFTIAILGGIESLLSAVVADGMTGEKHRSNTELIGQGMANIITPFFGGIPATGAIARTAANIKSGAKSPISGVVHALTLLLIVLFFGKFAGDIPMATLAGILVVVSYNMSDWRNFKDQLTGPQADIAVLIITFLLTVIFNLIIGIQVGMVLSTFLFMGKMAKASKINIYNSKNSNKNKGSILSEYDIPSGVAVFDIRGAFFFGAASAFENVLLESQLDNQVIILRMRQVYILDGSGLSIMKRFIKNLDTNKIKLYLCEINDGCKRPLNKSGILRKIGENNIFETLEDALKNAQTNISL